MTTVDDILINMQLKGVTQVTQGFKKIQKEAQTISTVLNKSINKRGNFEQVNRELSRLSGKTVPMTTNKIQELSVAGWGWNKVMGSSMETMKGLNNINRQGMTRMGRFAFQARKATHGLRGFRMEMLGVMFFGMGLQKFFTGLLQPALKLTGVFELWSTVLAILFLPIALLLLDFMMPLFMWLINLSDETKLFIGKLVLLGAILGAALFLFGMFALGIGSVILAFAGLFLIIDKLIPDIHFAGIEMSSFIEAGLGIGILGGAFELFKGTIGTVLDAILGLDFINDFLQRMGIEVDDSKKGWESFRDVVKNVWVKIQEKWGKIELKIGEEKLSIATWIRVLQTRWHQFVVNFQNDNKGMLESFNDLSDSLSNFLTSIDWDNAATVIDTLAIAINALATAVKALTSPFRAGFAAGEFLGTGLANLINEAKELTGKQTGGFIPHTGLYKLHAGESVNQAGGTFTSSPTINVFGATNEDLISQISNAITNDLASLSRR